MTLHESALEIIWNPSHLLDIQMVCNASLLCQLLWVWSFLHLQTWLSEEINFKKGILAATTLVLLEIRILSSGYNWGLHAWSIIPCTVCLHLLWFRPLKCLGPSPAAAVWPEGMNVAQYTHRIHKWHSSLPPCSTNQHPTHPFLVFLRLCIDSSTPRCTNFTCKVSLAAFLGP